ncbi:hypothetical protein R4227_21890 [Gordonia amicalis]|uniref:hypothetical protein n=1 Tax=Gordonia amicalis TaxID=89053 RepID=UPI0029558EFD|nr:hypothetical protein [Gordonia amicalis]MDV7102675.1 hypothetical protein [Gordonia amicalis]
MTEKLTVDPDDIKKAGEGINGVIDGLGDTTTAAGYTAALGRGYGDLDLDGKSIGHADPKAGLEEYCDRWEWGVRALVTGAAELSRGLGLGASHYEREEKWAEGQFRDMVMDIAGDPSLTAEDIKKMSWGDLWDHNRNVLTNPEWSLSDAEKQRHLDFAEENRASFLNDLATIKRHQMDPRTLIDDTMDGFERDGFTAGEPPGDERTVRAPDSAGTPHD